VAGITDMVLASPLDVGVVGEMGPVNPGFMIGGKRVCDQKTQARMDDQDGRVWAEQQVGIGAVGFEGRFGTDDDR
jgi:hypothetical protein